MGQWETIWINAVFSLCLPFRSSFNPSLSPGRMLCLLQGQGLLMSCFDSFQDVTWGLTSLAGFFPSKYKVLRKNQKQHFRHSIHLKGEEKKTQSGLCLLPLQSQQLSSHHLGLYPVLLLALISLYQQGKICLLWVTFVSLGLNSLPILSFPPPHPSFNSWFCELLSDLESGKERGSQRRPTDIFLTFSVSDTNQFSLQLTFQIG